MLYFQIALVLLQLVVGVVVGLYFLHALRRMRQTPRVGEQGGGRELENLKKMRDIRLSEPLTEKTRPRRMEEIIGQEEGIKALRAALTGAHPQHVIIYGPPGVGKTAAARIVLEEAKKNPLSPFKHDASFVELDATTARFDERGIADPLIGSVHDPIYQGAGALGQAGVPQPKPGAVSRAHGGILFIDEIGELHPIQMNKLLKVLEERTVYFESAYYSPDHPGIPPHIHDIFQNGLPADFRLIGATTRQPEELPPALRSRCVEIFFRPLTEAEIMCIAEGAIRRLGLEAEKGVTAYLARYATSGRQAVGAIQLAGSLALSEKRREITRQDLEWVVETSRLVPRLPKFRLTKPALGKVAGLAVVGPDTGAVIPIEARAYPRSPRQGGKLTVSGMIEEERIHTSSRSMRRTSLAKSSLDNVLTVLKGLGLDPESYDLSVNIPGGMPVDGPSAGVALLTALYSAMSGHFPDHRLAMTGEVGIDGMVHPVGGVRAKIEAAREAGYRRVLIPADNMQEAFKAQGAIEIIPCRTVEDVLDAAIIREASGVTEKRAERNMGEWLKSAFDSSSIALDQTLSDHA
ncbi:MAG: ATP-dependent protease LonB [Candidatus Carbobacillus altaicus]|uniref:endopeptidase La n=1 Tax=Candidatus Carbonibacillus altaicus TaxID=2163959 RepID=A0A2R6Y1H7_9BACL|nr:ATP-dependent protease LonB [Candidatus Carbobacillus altaicus]PTQ56527.1 MAG: ATP-dependent protease La [Candidatus Carbobacillus altaicus]